MNIYVYTMYNTVLYEAILLGFLLRQCAIRKYVYIYIYTYIYVYIYIYTCVYIYEFIDIHDAISCEVVFNCGGLYCSDAPFNITYIHIYIYTHIYMFVQHIYIYL